MQLYSVAAILALEQAAIGELGLSEATLMQRAGLAAFNFLCAHYPLTKRLAVLCGTGNNAGDGYVVADLARAAGMQVIILQVGDEARLSDAAAQVRHSCCVNGLAPISVASSEPLMLPEADLWLDALLGIGLKGEVRGRIRDAIVALNKQTQPILALDVPSGLHADTGQILGEAVRADSTVTFIGVKRGLVTGQAANYVGHLEHTSLALPKTWLASHVTSHHVIDDVGLTNSYLAPRARCAHKGHYGHVLIVGGAPGYAGAIRMAGEAALRVGAGLVSLATHAEHAAVIASQCPALMCHAVTVFDDLAMLLERARVVVLGPGLGQDDWSHLLWHWVVTQCDKDIVIDADGLNLLSTQPRHSERWILTPHPGEAARLLQTTTVAIEADRYHAAAQLQARYGGVCVLKGAGTLVQSEQACAVCVAGNPGMASAGMGDVLSGVIGGLLAQGLDQFESAQLGVALHAKAGDLAAAELGERGLLATDLIARLQYLVNPQSASWILR